jgi:hypothetical protein
MSNDQAVIEAINAIFFALKQIVEKMNYLESEINRSKDGES